MKKRAPAEATPSQVGIWRVRASPMHAVVDLFGDTWVLQILRQISTGEQRFDALVEALGLPRSTLSSRLKLLIAEKVLTSRYALTPRGAEVMGAVFMLDGWNARSGVGAAPAQRPLHVCGEALELQLGCAHCREEVTPRTTRVLDLPGSQAPRRKGLPRYRRRRHVEVKMLTAQDCFGDRWVTLVLGAMFFGVNRFSELVEALEIAPNILSARLQLLQHNRIIEWRTPIEGQSGHYALTAKGRDLFPIVLALLAWGERWLTPAWQRAAGYGLLHRPCADWLQAVVRCAACDADFHLADVRWTPIAHRRAS